jgi:hypothetical protein
MTTKTAPKLTSTDRYSITYADPNGHTAWRPGTSSKTETASRQRMLDAGLVVVSTKTYSDGATLITGTWLTEAGWILRREMRAAENLPADEIVKPGIMHWCVRPTGAVKLTYSPDFPADKYYGEAGE